MTKKIHSSDDRRRFLKLIGGGAVVVPLFGLGGCSKQEPTAPPPAPAPMAAPPAVDTTPAASAATAPDATPAEPTPAATPAAAPPAAASGALPHLEETDSVAKALGYHQDASTVDGSKYPQHVAGQACHKCVQFRGAPGVAWGPCNIFSANLVNANGWCTAFAAKA